MLQMQILRLRNVGNLPPIKEWIPEGFTSRALQPQQSVFVSITNNYLKYIFINSVFNCDFKSILFKENELDEYNKIRELWKQCTFLYYECFVFRKLFLSWFYWGAWEIKDFTPCTMCVYFDNISFGHYMLSCFLKAEAWTRVISQFAWFRGAW